jgi:hypothetical protein
MPARISTTICSLRVKPRVSEKYIRLNFGIFYINYIYLKMPADISNGSVRMCSPSPHAPANCIQTHRSGTVKLQQAGNNTPR